MQTLGPYLHRGELARPRGGYGFDPDVFPRQQPGNGEGVEILLRLWRRKKLIALTTAGTLALGLLATAALPQRFSSEAQIMVGAEPMRVTNMEKVVRDPIADLEVVQTEGYVLQSREIAGRVVNRLALDQDPEFNPFLRNVPVWRRAISYVTGSILNGFRWLMGERRAPSVRANATDAELDEIEKQVVTSVLLSNIEVTPLNRSHILSIVASSQNPVAASRIANAFADVYVEQQLVGKAEAAKSATGVLTQQIGELRQRVEESERAVEEYKRTHGLYQAKAATVSEQQLSELNSQLILAESDQAEVEARLRQAEGALKSPNGLAALPDVLRSPLIHSLREKQVEMERLKAEMGSTYGAKHPKMQDVEAQARDVQSAVKSEISNIVAGLRHETQAARARVGTLRGNLDRIKRDMDVTNTGSIKLRELEREAEANRTILYSFLERSKETRAQASMSGDAGARLISRAATPLSPSFPPTNVILVVAGIIGSVLGACVALMVEGLDRTFRTRQQVEELTGLQTLALVPAVKAKESARVLDDVNSPFSESLRALHMRLLFNGNSRAGGKIVMFTSAAPHEGKSRISISLARLIARTGRRVIVVDCDWQRPMVHRHFGQKPYPGLADLLNGDVDAENVVHQDRQTGAHAIFAGNVRRAGDDPQRMERLRPLLRTLAKHYDLVIVDSLPVLTGSEALSIATLVDRVVFVVRWGRTPRQVVLDGLQQIGDVHGKLAGVVLSQVDPKRYRRYGVGPIAHPYGSVGSIQAS